MRPLAAAMVLLGLLAAACGGGTPSASPAPSAVPVTPLAGTRACDPQDLRSVLNAPIGVAGPQVDAGVALFNASESDCMLEGLPGLELFDNQKNLLTADIFALCDEANSGCPSEYPVLLVPSRTNVKPLLAGASVALKWTAPAGSQPCDSPLQVAFLQVSIPGGQVWVPVNSSADKLRNTIELCGGRLGVGRFESISVDLAKFQQPFGLPTPTPTPFINHSVRPCTAADLAALFSRTSAATGGQLVGGIGFGNLSDTACRLEGQPVVELLDSRGAPIALEKTDFCFGQPCVTQSAILAPHADNLAPDKPNPGGAGLVLFWPTHRGDGTCADPPAVPAATARITLPEGGGTLDVPAGPDPIAPCHTLGVGVFQATH